MDESVKDRNRELMHAVQPRSNICSIYAIMLLVVIMAATAGCSLLPKEEEVLLPPLVKPQQQVYELYEVKRGTVVKAISGKAKFEANHAVSQQFIGVSGKIIAVHVKRGDTVRQGDPLIELEHEDLEITLLERERDVELAKLQLDQAKANGKPQLIKVRSLELEIAEFLMDEVLQKVNSSVMKAEIDGVIVSMEQVTPGNTVQNGLDYLTIVNPDNYHFTFTSTAPEMQEVQIGMSAEITYQDRVYEAIITQSPASAPMTNQESAPGSASSKIYLELKDDVQPSFQANPDLLIILERKENVVIVPRNAVHTLFDRHFVRVLDGESIKEIDIAKGIESPQGIEVIHGLDEGMLVILQ